VTLYVPDAVLKKLRADARRAKKSLSAYVAELAAGRPSRRGLSRAFLELQGSCQGTLVAPEDPPPDEPDAL